MRQLLLASLIVMLAAETVHALVWSLVLGNPVIDMKDESASSHGSGVDDVMDSSAEDGDSDLEHPRNIKLKTAARNSSSLSTGSRPTRQHHGQDKCMEDKQCGKGRFCDLHYGVCRTEKSPGFACRRDRMCGKGLACMFGRCQAKIATGEEGSRCHGNSDCQAGLCCARRHGEAVCQRKLTLGQRCFVPEGGLEYSLNQLCPCDVGLVCRQQNPAQLGGSDSPSSQEDNSFDRSSSNSTSSENFPFWTSTENMRCTFHDMGNNRAS
ncbi:dickkopf-related protein 3-like isoform X1 [Daphnia pulicaria]|uniref:dickkopf-related protein 3-like isoform X1 n=1 Tax=Daphnia pulicaria TaxID=35523 RepID=UPI001EEADE7A|nr:dickkopf-related protein 3-like isoform X1 [Daphnia pulicaria]